MKILKRNGIQKRMLENIYDIIIDSQFKNQAIKELKQWRKGKVVEIDYTEGRQATIKVGRDFIITLNGILK